MGKNYIIFGASSGIGKACVESLASEENQLVIVARRIDLLKEIADSSLGYVYPVQYDLNDLENIKDVFRICTEHQFKLDGMVYSAGMDGTWPVKVNNIRFMQQMMNINCFAFVEVSKYFYSKRYSNDGASIVAISSIASLTSEIGMVSYSASKAALNSVVKTMSKEFIRRNIRVNAVLPGGVATPMAEEKGQLLSGIAEVQIEDNKNPQKLGMIPASYIANEVRRLLSDESRYTTGEMAVISGGREF